MASPRNIVYVDTNVIIEATRTSCWKALLNRFEIHTVEEVRREALHIPKSPTAYIPIDPQLIKDQVKVAKVEKAEILRASLKSPGIAALDPGERDLLAHLAGRPADVWLLATADRAALKTACQLGLNSKLVSLEQLASECGLKPKLNDWFTKNWLSKTRMEFLLDSL